MATLGLLVAGFCWTGVAQAGDAGSLKQALDEAYGLYKKGDTAGAAAKARAVLASNPSSEDAYEVVRRSEGEQLVKLLAAGGDLEQVATYLLKMAHSEEVARSQDPDAIKALVGKATDPASDLKSRTEAARQLAAAHGEYAVPSLVVQLGSNDTERRTNAIIALSRIAADGVMALSASLETGNDTQKQNVAMLLGRIGDERAVPALLRAAKGPAGKHAADAAAKLGGSGDAAAAYLALARKFFQGDPQTLRNYDGTYAVWSASDANLVKRDVPRFMYHFELAEQACYDALAVNPASAEARAMIALVTFAEVAAWDNLSDEARQAEELASSGQALGGAGALAAATGTGDLLAAVKLGSEIGAGHAVAKLAAACADSWDGRDLDAGNALVEGLGHADKTVRYACAVALLRIDPAKAFPKSNMVAEIAGKAASEVAVRQVLVIDSDSKNAMNVQRKLNDSGYHAVAAPSGASGLRMAKGTGGGFDVVVVRSRLADMTTFQVLDELGRDFRTQGVKVVVMAEGADVGEAQSEFESRGIAGVAPTSEDPTGVANAVKAALDGDSGSSAQQRASALSIAASHALASSSGAAFDLSGAQAGLLAAAGTGAPDDVRMAALHALANCAKADAQGPLAAIAARTENSAGIRGGACKALAHALRGQAPSPEAMTALMGAMGDSDNGVRTAAGAALGAAKLTDAQRAEVLNKQRVN